MTWSTRFFSDKNSWVFLILNIITVFFPCVYSKFNCDQTVADINDIKNYLLQCYDEKSYFLIIIFIVFFSNFKVYIIFFLELYVKILFLLPIFSFSLSGADISKIDLDK